MCARIEGGKRKKKVEKSEYETTEGHKEIDDRGVKSSNNSTVPCNFVDGGEIQILFLQFSSAILQITRKWELSSLPGKMPFRWDGGSAYYHKNMFSVRSFVFVVVVAQKGIQRTTQSSLEPNYMTVDKVFLFLPLPFTRRRLRCRLLRNSRKETSFSYFFIISHRLSSTTFYRLSRVVLL